MHGSSLDSLRHLSSPPVTLSMLGQSPPERLSPELYPPDFPFPLYPFTTSRACLPLTYLKSTLSPSKSMQPPKPSPPHPVLRALAASVASLMITCAFLQGPRPLPLVRCLWPPPKPLQYVDQEGADPLLPSLPYFIASCPPQRPRLSSHLFCASVTPHHAASTPSSLM